VTRALVALFLVLVSTGAHAAWQPGYEAPRFRGGQAYCAIPYQGRLVVGGDFELAGCAISSGVAFVEDGAFSTVPTTINADVRPVGPSYRPRGVFALAEFEGDLVAGGSFELGYSATDNIARWDGQRWRAFETSRGRIWLVGGAVRHLAVVDGTLYAGGDFTGDNQGTSLPGLARWTDDGWVAMPVPPGGSRRAIAAIDGELYGGLARWTGDAWEALTTWTGTPTVTAIDRVDGGIAYGGYFDTIDGQEIPGAALRRDDGRFVALGGDLEISYPYPPLGNETVSTAPWAFASYAGRTYTIVPQGGPVSYIDRRTYVLNVLEGGEWVEPEGVRTPDLYGAARGDLVVHDGELVALIASADLADLEAHGALPALRFDGSAWRPLIDGRGVGTPVTALAVAEGRVWAAPEGLGLLHETDRGAERRTTFSIGSVGRTPTGVYATGTMQVISDVPTAAVMLREYDLDATGAVTEIRDVIQYSQVGGYGATVRAVPWQDSYLLAVSIDQGTGSQHSYFAAPWTMVVSFGGQELEGIDPFSGTVDALAVHDGQPWYATDNQVFRIDGDLAGPISATLVGTFNAPVKALTSDGSRLVVGGAFDSVNAITAHGLAAFENGTWTALPAIDGTVEALASSEGFVVVGGRFTAIGDVPTRHVAVLRGHEFGAFPDGPTGPGARVTAVAVEPDRFVVAGDFVRVGDLCAAGLARWESPLSAVGIDAPLDDEPATALSFHLAKPAPNPFNAHTNIAFGLERAGTVQLVIVDAAGRRVRTLRHGALSAGRHVATWNGRDERGRAVASGVYHAALTFEGRRVREALVLVK